MEKSCRAIQMSLQPGDAGSSKISHPFSLNIKDIDSYLKSGVSKSIVHVKKHVNFHLYRTHPDGF